LFRKGKSRSPSIFRELSITPSVDLRTRGSLSSVSKIKNGRPLVYHLYKKLEQGAVLRNEDNAGLLQHVVLLKEALLLPQEVLVVVVLPERFILPLTRIYTFIYWAISRRKLYFRLWFSHFRRSGAKKMQPR
jgi:hypothetical protein